MKKIIFFILFTSQIFALSNAKVDIFSDVKSIKSKDVSHIQYPLKSGQILGIIAPNYRQMNKKVTVFIDGEKKQFLIKKNPFKEEKITLLNPKINHPDKKLQNRIKKESSEIAGIYLKPSKKSYLKRKFHLPLNSFITSPFGTARLFDGEVKSYHSGTDFRAAMNTKIPASNDGVVVLAKNRYFTGNSVIIDHGHGIFTQYYHLNKILVKKGEVVKRDQLIGLSGMSGRVSGPHLHFGVTIKATSVDPIDFVTKINEYL